jgi:hypothetical protein
MKSSAIQNFGLNPIYYYDPRLAMRLQDTAETSVAEAMFGESHRK